MKKHLQTKSRLIVLLTVFLVGTTTDLYSFIVNGDRNLVAHFIASTPEPEPTDYSLEYFTITSWEPGNTITFHRNIAYFEMYISYDKIDWTLFTSSSNTNSTVVLGVGEKAYFKATTYQLGTNDIGSNCNFSATKLFEASGNIMSLIHGDNFVDATSFYSTNDTYAFNFIDLFGGATTLLTLENLVLPVTQYNMWVFQGFASGCSSLIRAPKELPAQNYQGQNSLVWMFSGCPKLQESPVIRLTSNASGDGWYQMFSGCSSLKRVICLLEGTNLRVTGSAWLNNVPSGGVFYKKSSSTWQSGNTAIPSSWTTRDWSEDSADFVKVTSTPVYRYSCYVEGISDYYQVGDNVTLKCTPINDYSFNGWYVNGILVSTSDTYSFTASQNVEVTPSFGHCSVTASVNPTNGGTVSGAGSYDFGSTCILTASPAEGYTFANWTQDGTVVSTEASYTFTVTQNADFVANFVLFENQYFTIESLEDDNTITLTIGAGVTQDQLQSVAYSTDNGATWNTTNIDNTEQVISVKLNASEKVLWKGLGTSMASADVYDLHWSVFNSTKQFVVSGNIMSLLYGDVFATRTEFPVGSTYTFSRLFSDCGQLVSASNLVLFATNSASYCYYQMFSGCTSLTEAPAMPSTTLAQYCYDQMFSGCTSLVEAPALPATNLAQYCYQSMFSGCTSLAEAPALPATTLADNCYVAMFYGCTSLTEAPALPATTLARACYYNMFSGCTSLAEAPALPATTLADYCYSVMFEGCTSLAEAPALPATTLALYCYQSMFSGCTLAEAPALPATTLAQYCYQSMFSGCTLLTEAPALPATTLAHECYDHMFEGCTSLAEAPPALPATTLANSCYSGMFYGCTSLTEAPALPATTLADYCYGGMFQGCTSLVEAPALPATTLADACYSDMFFGCTSLTEAPALPATTLADYCYEAMFYGCTSLNEVTCLATDISATGCTTNWLSGVAATGTFRKNIAMENWTPNSASGIPEGWNVEEVSIACSITATANPIGGGTVSGAGDYYYGSTCTLTAEPNEDWIFLNWSKDGIVVSYDNPYSFVVMEDRDLVAHFVLLSCTLEPENVQVQVNTNDYTEAMVSWDSDNDLFDLRYSKRIENLINEGFEGGIPDGWAIIDADGDGNNWMLGSVLMAGYTIYPYSGGDMICSQSYLGGTVLTPDNYLVTPCVFLGGTFSFWACAQDANYAAEHFGVAVSTASQIDPSDFVTVQEWTMTAKSIGQSGGMTRSGNRNSGAWYQYTVDLSAYEGQIGYIAIRHFECSDMYYLNVDDVYYEGPGEDEEVWTVISNISNHYYSLISLDDMSDYIVQVRSSCGDGETYSNWVETTFANKHYVINAMAEPEEGGEVFFGSFFDFEDGLQGWTTIDADVNTNHNWYHSGNSMSNSGYDYTGLGHSGSNGFAVSQSYIDYNGAYQADNYLVSPQMFVLQDGSNITFWADYANDNYPDNFGVYISTAAIPMASSFTMVWEGNAKEAGEKTVVRHNGTRYENWRQHTVDLSVYAGQTVWIAFRHNDYDMYEIWIDDITIKTASATTGYLQGANCTVFASPNPGYQFVNWTENGEEVSTDTVYTFAVTENHDLVANFVLTCTLEPENLQVQVNTDNYTEATVSWTSDNDLFELTYYNGIINTFEFESLENWTTIDADGDGRGWYLVYSNTSNSGYGNSKGYVGSDSYTNGVGALTPDNYLVSPRVELGGTLAFFARAQSASWADEHFGVAVSTTTNDDASAFTTIQEWTMTAKGAEGPASDSRGGNRAYGNWYLYSVDLSAYAGQMGYVAIRHFDCTDMFHLNVDDVYYIGQFHKITDITDTSYTLTGLDDMSDYYVGVRSSCGDGENFSDLVGALLNTNHYTIAVTSDPEEGGVVTGAGVYGKYTICTVQAEPADGYTFMYWTEDGVRVSSEATYSFVATTDRNLVAHFILPSVKMVMAGYDPDPDDDQSNSVKVYWSMDTHFEPGWIYYDDGANTGAVGTNGGQFSWGIMFPAGTYTGNSLTKVSAYDYMAMTGKAFVYQGGDTAPGTALDSVDVVFTGVGEFVEFVFDSPVTIDPEQNLWVVFRNDSGATYPAANCANTGDPNGRWVSVDGVSWIDLVSAGLNDTFMVRAFVVNAGKEGQYGLPDDMNRGEVSYYKVYRAGAGNADSRELIADNVVETSFLDSNWSTLSDGWYQYGVSANYSAGESAVVWSAPIKRNVQSQLAEQPLSLAAGWNWWSSYLEMDATVEGALKDAIAAENTTATIKSMTGNIMLENGTWSSGLTLNNESMFMIQVNNAVTATLTAEAADPTAHTITLNPGWNWIGFPSVNPMTLTEALAGITPNEEDVIKGSASNATYTADYGWNGSLTSLTPGLGYMYLNGGTSALTLTYPATSKAYVRSLPAEAYWTTDTHRFATNMVMLATLDADRFAMAAGNYEIGAFVGDECRGSARLQQVGSRYIAYLTISGENAETVRFRLYDVVNAMELGMAEEQMAYVANAVTGTTHEPVVLNFRSTGVGEGDHNMVSVFPNPTKDKVMVEGYAIETVKVYNVMGQLVQMEQCGNATNVELHLSGLSAGVYTVEVTNAYGTVNRRIVKE